MIKFAICNEIFKGWSLEKTCRYVAEAGYDALEIAPFTIANHVTDIPASERQKIRETAARHGLAISGIHWVLAQTEGMHLTHPDPGARQRTSDYLAALVNFCADLGGAVVVFGSPKQRSLLPDVKFEQGREWALEAFRRPVRRAEEKGVTICFEPLAPSETNFINTAAEAIEFTRQLASPAFKIILDVKAMCSEARPVPQIIRESWPEFAYFHANDKNLKGPGFGEVDFNPIAAALKETGYDGYVSVEVFNFDEGAEEIASKSIAYLKKVFC
jgi:sugar phosphate isomerase/epimerase